MLFKFFKFFLKSSRTLYLVRGVSGSGKSTLAGSLTPWNVAADDFPGLYRDGQYQIQFQADSHSWCEAQVERWMREGKRAIAVHNTSVKPKYYQRYLDLAAQHNYAVQLVHAEAVILPDGSKPGNVHGVGQEILDRQKQNWEAF